MSGDPEELRLQALEQKFADVVAAARLDGFDLADVQTCMARTLGRASATLPNEQLALRAFTMVANMALRAYLAERALLLQAETQVYRGGGALRRRRR